MVGVPGRSKACHTCRQRKVRCGGEVPACGNCAKLKRVCTGYQRQHAFILSQAMVPAGSRQAKRPASREDELCSGSVMVSRWRIDPAQSSTGLSRAQSNIPNTLATTMTLPRQVTTRNVFREKLLAMMADNDFAEGGGFYRVLGDRHDWPLHILNLPSLTPALENALLALCTSRLGRHTGQSALVRESLKLYTQGVSQARRDLLHESTRKDEQSLAACMTLLSYETLECPGGSLDGYQTHYRGCLELLELGGAFRYTSGLARATLQILRLHTVIRGSQLSESSFLAQPEWLEVPWSSKSASKEPFDKLIDIMLNMPDFFARVRGLAGVADPSYILQSACLAIREGERIEESLAQWLNGFQRAVPGALYHAGLSKIDTVADTPELGKLFPVAFHFPAFVVGQAMVFYWVAVMSVQANLCLTYGILKTLMANLEAVGRGHLPCVCLDDGTGAERCLQHFTMERLPELAHRDGWTRGAAYNICQSVEYFLLDTARGFGPPTVLPALGWVKGFWKHAPGQWDREIGWVDDMVGRIHATGYGIAGAMLGRGAEQKE